MLEIAILSLAAVLNLLLGLAVYLKNPKSATNRYFFLLTGVFVTWSIVNYVSVHPVILSQLSWIRLVLFCGSLLNMSVFLAFLAFPANSLSERQIKKAKLAVLSTAFIMLLTLTPFVFKTLKIVNGSAEPVPAPGIALFLIHTLTLLGSSIFIILKRYHSSKGRTKDQLRLVLFGLAGTFSLIILSNLLLVVIFKITALVPFGPAFTLIFSSSFAYAIVRHRLFDIRAAVARAVAYLLSLGSIAFVYSVFILGITETFLDSAETTTFQRAFYIILAVLTSFIYQPVKHFFDKLTNRIFFQDAYDPQFLIDQLNRTLVTNIDLEPILRKSSEIIEVNLKSEFCVFGLRKTAYTASRNIGPHGSYKLDINAEALEKATSHIKQHVIVADELLDENQNNELHKLLQANNVAMLIKLVTPSKGQTENIGYLMLGSKKSGNTYTGQDVKVIGIIANELAVAVENALRFEEIQRFNVTLQDKVDDATRQLRRTNEKLKALDETKDEFISMASHQLRTPLTSVKGYLSMVIEGDSGKITASQHKLLDQAFISSQRMVYLIADLLNVSRLRTGKFIIEDVPTDLAEAVQGEYEQLVETAAGRKLELKYHKPKDFPLVMLDETKIRQVIMNFVDNAIYYTPAGGHIKLELNDLPTSVEFTVTDDGLGVPKHEQHHLFTKFYRAANAKQARPDGTGLGLFMAKKVIIAQGGSLIFKSQEGKGSTFGFSFAKSKLKPLPPSETAKS